MSLLGDCTGAEPAAVARCTVGSILILAGVLKAASPPDVSALARGLGIDPSRREAAAMRFLPLAESALGCGLFTGFWVGPILAVSLALFVAFTFVVLRLARRGNAHRCACFGAVDDHPVGIVQFGRNVVLVGATGALLVDASNRACVARPPWDLPFISLVLTGGSVTALAGLYVLAAEVERFARGAATDAIPTAKEE